MEKTYDGQAASLDLANFSTKVNDYFKHATGIVIPNLTDDDLDWVDENGRAIAVPKNVGTYYLQLNKAGRDAIANANKNYSFTDAQNNSRITGRITYKIDHASLVIGVSGTASKTFDGQKAVVTQSQLDDGEIKLVWGNGTLALPDDLSHFTLTPDDLEVVDGQGNAAVHTNVHSDKTIGPVYYVRLKDSVLERIQSLTGAQNYTISLSTSTGNYLIYSHKAQVTLSGNQTAIYGTDLPLDATKYVVSLTNWQESDGTKPDLATVLEKIGRMQDGDVYIDGYKDGEPKDVGIYRVRISDQLFARLKQAFPDYTWGDDDGQNADAANVITEHDPATYVIKRAVATVNINGTQHIRYRYGEPAEIQYGGDNGYTITITAPVDGKQVAVNTGKVKFDARDLQFVTTPGDAGTYAVKLSQKGLAKLLQDLPGAANYNWQQVLDELTTPTAAFYVDPMPITITVGGEPQTVTYGSQQWLDAIKANPEGYSLTVKTENGTTLSYEVKDGDLTYSQTPGDVGSYDVVLSAQGLANIKAALKANYTYPQLANVVSHGTLKVTQGEVTVTLSGRDGKTYDGQAAAPADLKTDNYSLKYSATVYSPDGTSRTIELTNDDLQFVGGNPVNQGHYQVELSPAGQARLEDLAGNSGENYHWIFKTKATYDINPASASVELTGSNQKVFDGMAVTTKQVNNGGSIVVNLTFPGSTKDSTYLPQNGDYDWYTADGKTKLDSAPLHPGTYLIKLTAAGLTNLRAALNSQAGSGNVTLNEDGLSGSAAFTIVAKPITNVTVSGQPQSKTYDGKAAVLDINGLTVSGNGILTSLSAGKITASDFDWYDENGTKLAEAPTDAGTYEARLTSRALAVLQAVNPDYGFSAANGAIKYTINQASANAKFSGTITLRALQSVRP